MTEQKRFGRLKASDPLVLELASGRHPWWSRLVEISRTDRDINIQVRGTYLNVYCNMGNLLKVYMNGKKVACAVHYKDLVGAHTPEYIEVFPTEAFAEARVFQSAYCFPSNESPTEGSCQLL